MSSLNLCQFIGRVGKDPTTKYTQSGDAITNISLAVDESYKNKSTGEKIEKCELVNVTFYRKLAEIAGEYLHKGSLIYVSGKMETRKYTDKNGVEKYATNIIAHELKMLGSKPGQSESNGIERTKTETQTGGFDDMSDDIPW